MVLFISCRRGLRNGNIIGVHDYDYTHVRYLIHSYNFNVFFLYSFLEKL